VRYSAYCEARGSDPDAYQDTHDICLHSPGYIEMSGLRDALARHWGWLRRRERGEEGTGRAEARRRFWSEFREGQRQAEQTSSEKRPRKDRDA